jgi:hypothetical protein
VSLSQNQLVAAVYGNDVLSRIWFVIVDGFWIG